jgi:hypothetical protein
LYLDPDAHAAFTGFPVGIGPKPGDAFRAFDGVSEGRHEFYRGPWRAYLSRP